MVGTAIKTVNFPSMNFSQTAFALKDIISHVAPAHRLHISTWREFREEGEEGKRRRRGEEEGHHLARGYKGNSEKIRRKFGDDGKKI
jgi:hypothetical protein